MPRNYKSFIFDLDGTLVDSSSIIEQVMRKWCDENNIIFSDIQDSAHSSRTQDTVRSVAPRLDAKQEAEKIEKMEREALTNIKEIKGASAFLRKLPEEQWAIATSSDSTTAKAKLNSARMPLPRVLIGADHVHHGKPHPESYLKASKGLGCEPCECLAFEDSETGVRSALQAGCFVVVVGSHSISSDSKIVGRIKDFEEVKLVFSEDSLMRIEF